MAKKNAEEKEYLEEEAAEAVKPEEQDPWEPVAIRVKRTDTSDQDLFIGFNGKNYLLPKNKISYVPRCVADELIRSRHAQEVADEHIDDMLEKAAEAEAYLRG